MVENSDRAPHLSTSKLTVPSHPIAPDQPTSVHHHNPNYLLTRSERRQPCPCNNAIAIIHEHRYKILTLALALKRKEMCAFALIE